MFEKFGNFTLKNAAKKLNKERRRKEQDNNLTNSWKATGRVYYFDLRLLETRTFKDGVSVWLEKGSGCTNSFRHLKSCVLIENMDLSYKFIAKQWIKQEKNQILTFTFILLAHLWTVWRKVFAALYATYYIIR